MKARVVSLIWMTLFSMSRAADPFPEPGQLPVLKGFPDPLVLRSGEPVRTAAQWREQRAPELRALFEHYEYGVFPAKPQTQAVTLLRTDPTALGGKATLKELEVRCTQPDATVYLLVLIPNRREKPAPCFLGMNFHGNYALLPDPAIRMPSGWVSSVRLGAPPGLAAEAVRGKERDVWNVEQIIDRGYAFASFFSGDVVPDKPDLARKRLEDFVSPGGDPAAPTAPAVIGAWAWGFSRMLDHLVTEPGIDSARIAAVGHSRNGKTALWAAAMDSRFALLIASQAGCGGSAPCRVPPELAVLGRNGRPTVETVSVINRVMPHWFCGNFKAFGDAVEKLPFDQHALLALCAPRPVLLSNATEDLWANPSGQWSMLRAADPVYRLVCGEGCETEQAPPVGKLLKSRLGFFIRPGAHSMNTEDWSAWLEFADRWLKE
jgi:hypothetical protein